jgi:hypothetical protein
MVSQELAALRESVNLLADEIRAHDKWAKDYNVTVERRNEEVLERSRKQGEDHEKWLKNQIENVTAVVGMFVRMEQSIEQLKGALLHEQFNNGGKPCRAKSRTKKRK